MKKVSMAFAIICTTLSHSYCMSEGGDVQTTKNQNVTRNQDAQNINDLVTLLTPTLELFEEKFPATDLLKIWSIEDMKKELLIEFNPKEIETIVNFIKESGGIGYMKKGISIANKMLDLDAIQSFPIEKVDIDETWKAMIQKDNEVTGFVESLLGIYKITNPNESDPKALKTFEAKIENYIIYLIKTEYSFEEYKKEHEFIQSDLGKRMQRFFEKAVQPKNFDSDA